MNISLTLIEAYLKITAECLIKIHNPGYEYKYCTFLNFMVVVTFLQMFSISDYLEPANIKLRASKDCVSKMYFKITAGRGEVPLGLWSSIFTLQKMYPNLDNDYSTRLSKRQIAEVIKQLDMILLGLQCFGSLIDDR